MRNAVSSQTSSATTPPPTFSSDDSDWTKQVLFRDGILMHNAGIPSTHAKEIPDNATKHYIWTRKQGLHAISLFKHDDTETYYVHVANGGRDYLSDTFDTISNAKKHVKELQDKNNL
mgnify:FL=1